MNIIIQKIESLINDNITVYLPDIKKKNLEGNGAIYYMNGKNGTEFDWFVNNKVSDFFVFYNDTENLGAVKLTLYCSGDVTIYLYDDNGHHLKEEINTSIGVSSEDLIKFTVLLKATMDDKLIWDAIINRIDVNFIVTPELIQEFENHKKDYQGFIERKELFNKSCYVSKKILEEGWKVGYMSRDKAINEMDSGWCFMVGNEDDEYLNDYHNIALLDVGYICKIDSDLIKYIGNPVGAELIRVSSDSFEIDKHDRNIFFEKRV